MSRKGLGEAYQDSFFSQTVFIFREFSAADENFLSSSTVRLTKMQWLKITES